MTAGLVERRATATRRRTRSSTPAPRPFDADSDGDGVLDGADDQDFDDVPNIMELSRNMAGDVADPGAPAATPARRRRPASPPTRRCVNPFNPCLPDRDSRTCPRHPAIGDAYPPFDPDWEPYVLN